MAAKIHGCAGCVREVFAAATAHQIKVAKEMTNEAIRMYRRNGCVPGKYRSAGMAVWLITKNSGNPHLSFSTAGTVRARAAVLLARTAAVLMPAPRQAVAMRPFQMPATFARQLLPERIVGARFLARVRPWRRASRRLRRASRSRPPARRHHQPPRRERRAPRRSARQRRRTRL